MVQKAVKKTKKGKAAPSATAAGLDAASASMADLEAIVFGRGAEFVAPTSTAEEPEDAEAGDRAATAAPKKRRKRAGGAAPSAVPKAAWADPDDAALEVDLKARNMTKKLLSERDVETKVSGVEYEQRLRNQFHKFHGPAAWAEKRAPLAAGGADSEEEDEVEVATSARLCAAAGATPANGGFLRPTVLDIQRLRNVDAAAKGGRGVVLQSCQFHPNSELLLTAGLDKRLQLFCVDGDENARVSSYFIDKFPIREAVFTPDGDQVLVTGMNFRMWALDIRTGDWTDVRCDLSAQIQNRVFGLCVGPNPADQPGLRTNQMYSVLGTAGSVLVNDVKSKLPIRTLRMSAHGSSAAFSPDNDSLWTADVEGGIYEWDLRTGRCKQRVRDPWASKISCLAFSRTCANAPSPVLAVGTETGNVDFFDIGGPHFPKEPTSSIDHITTRVTSLKFHHESQVLVAASKWKNGALKMVHMGTGTVYQNWPTNKTPLGMVSALDFSRKGGLLAMGNEQGRVLLYRLNQYN